MKTACVLLALTFVSSGGFADEIVSWSGTRERVIDARWIDIPLDLAAQVDAKAPAVIQVTASGRELNATAVKIELIQRNSQTYLHVWPDAEQFARAGTYLVKIRIPRTGNFSASNVELTLTRLAGDLSIATPMRTERVVILPGLVECWYPRRWPLSASGQNIQPTASERVVTFTGPDQKPIGAKLKLTLPRLIAAAKQNDVTLLTTTCFPLGTSTGKLTIEAPQLAKPFETTLEVVSRVSRWWLLITIALSILIGHYARHALETRRLRGLARAAFDEQLEVLRRAAEGTVDPEFKQRIEVAVTEMERAAGKKTAGLDEAVTNAKTKVGRIQEEMAAAQAQVETELRDLRAAIGNPATQLPPLRAALEELARDAEEAQTNLAAGQIGRAKISAAKLTAALPHHLETARPRWREVGCGLVRVAGAWPESPANDRLQQAGNTAAQTARVATFDEARAFVSSAASVTGDLRESLFAIVSGARDVSSRIAKELAPFRSLPDVAAALGALAALVDAPMTTEAGALAKEAKELRAAMTGALTSVLPQGTAAPPSIAEGKFAQALADVLAVRSAQPLSDAKKAEPFLVSSLLAESTAAAPAAEASVIPATLALDGAAVAGRYVRVRLQVDDPSIAAASVVVTWYRDDRRLYTAPAGELVLVYVADAQPAVIRAEITAGGRAGKTSTRIVPSLPIATDPSKWLAQSRWAEWKQTFVSGVFIVVIGYLIFADNFIGTLSQFVGAALWGFVVDVTLPKLIAYAQPVAGKAPPLP